MNLGRMCARDVSGKLAKEQISPSVLWLLLHKTVTDSEGRNQGLIHSSDVGAWIVDMDVQLIHRQSAS
jgi:hypothetical protein